MFIAVDFDGTIAEHDYPDIGLAVPGAFKWMREWQDAGAKLMLWTMRSDTEGDGPTLARYTRVILPQLLSAVADAAERAVGDERPMTVFAAQLRKAAKP